METKYNLVWRLFRASQQPPELVLHTVKSGTYEILKKFHVGRCVDVLWVFREAMQGEADQPI